MRIICIVGTRPNFVKMGPLYAELSKRPGIEPILVHTGQHYDAAMSDSFFNDLGLPVPDQYLDVKGGSHAVTTAGVMTALEPVLMDTEPDLVLVVGDVNSTLAATLTACKLNIPVAHVEAGLRSHDRTMPEEQNRICVDQLSSFLFATEQSALDNLRLEGIAHDKVFFVGNVMIDTLMKHVQKARESTLLSRFDLAAGQYVLATFHRASNTDCKSAMQGILEALIHVANDVPVLLPMHPRTHKRIDEFGLAGMVSAAPGLIVAPPLGYLDFLNGMMNAKAVLTDSGGIQEETTILGVPCLTMRENTERPITITEGTNRLVGIDRDVIIETYANLQSEPRMQSPPRPPLWDGRAARRIVAVLAATHNSLAQEEDFCFETAPEPVPVNA